MTMKNAAKEAIVNGVVIGALVAGAMILSNQVNNIVILRTTMGAMLLRFAFYMIENVENVDAGVVADYLGFDTRKGSWAPTHFFRRYHIGKLI